MQPTTEILARISKNSFANKEEIFTKLYRYLLRPDIYYVAYKNLYIYLHELDKFVMKLKTEFDRESDQRVNPEYSKNQSRLMRFSKRIEKSEGTPN